MDWENQVAYEQILEIIKQLPQQDVEKLLVEARAMSQKEKTQKDVNAFRKLLLSAPVMSKIQYSGFLEIRKINNGSFRK